jgi:hypothetical protein
LRPIGPVDVTSAETHCRPIWSCWARFWVCVTVGLGIYRCYGCDRLGCALLLVYSREFGAWSAALQTLKNGTLLPEKVTPFTSYVFPVSVRRIRSPASYSSIAPYSSLFIASFDAILSHFSWLFSISCKKQRYVTGSVCLSYGVCKQLVA